jgi:hypothetical protein
LKTVFHLISALWLAPAFAAQAEWLQDTVLAECRHCRSDAFREERKRIANQAGVEHDPASGLGYIVSVDGNGRFVWGRAALIGTGNLIRTDAHVLFADTGLPKIPHGKIYFEPMHHGAASDLIEIERGSVQRGGVLGPLETDLRDDWAIARLKEDAIEKFNGDRVFAFLWDIRVTHDDIVQDDYERSSALVLSGERAFELHASCARVTDDHPSRYAFGVEEVFFTRCPAEHVHAGSSGSALATRSRDGTWNLAGQIVAGGSAERVRAAAGEAPVLSGSFAQQVFLGNVPMLEQALASAYLEELIRRGLDPRDR